ncbi:MAG: aminotransferase class I/II-fold pyridoxal phosphate-dependent enzyme [Candidatus Dormibacteria bacterium]
MSPTSWIESELAGLDRDGLRRVPPLISGAAGPTVEVSGREYILLGSNNYLDLAGDSRVCAGAAEAAGRFGGGSGGSRLISGTLTIHRELEHRLAAFMGTEDAVLFSSGYVANVATIPAVVGRGDRVFSDALNHASIIDGCRLSQATVTVYPHADMDALAQALGSSTSRRTLVVSDSVFSMDADSAPLPELRELARDHGAMLMLDESHAVGVLGPCGGGLGEATGLAGEIDIVMGTLSKALGSAGGFIAASYSMCDLLRHRARGYIFDTAPAPAAVGAALAAMDVIQTEPWRRTQLREMTALLRAELRGGGLTLLSGDAAVVPVVLGEAEFCSAVAAACRERGIIVPAIRPPSVAAGSSRLRLTVSSGFDQSLVRQAAGAIVDSVASTT